MSWNPVLDKFVQVKRAFANRFGEEALWAYDPAETSCLAHWVSRLGSEGEAELIAPLTLNEHESLLLVRYDRLPPLPEGQDFWELHGGFYKECRSVVLDVREDAVVLAPFRKFRNVDECEETSVANVARRVREGGLVEFSDKLDGSMQSARLYKGRIVMSGSQALDPQASFRLREGYEVMERPEYRAMVSSAPGLTFVFELISPNDQHVVRSREEDRGLHLVGLRDVRDGRELPYRDVRDIARRFGVPACQVFDQTLEGALSSLDDKRCDEAEGCVINVYGWRVKLKYNDYVRMHRTISAASSPNYVVRRVADGTEDDLLAKLPGAFREAALRAVRKARLYESLMAGDIARQTSLLCAQGLSERKDAMIWISANVPRRLQMYVRMEWLGQPYRLLRRPNGRYLTMREVEEYLDGRAGAPTPAPGATDAP